MREIGAKCGRFTRKKFQIFLAMRARNSYDDANVVPANAVKNLCQKKMQAEKNILCLTVLPIFSNHHELPLMDGFGVSGSRRVWSEENKIEC